MGYSVLMSERKAVSRGCLFHGQRSLESRIKHDQHLYRARTLSDLRFGIKIDDHEQQPTTRLSKQLLFECKKSIESLPVEC